MTIEEFIEKCKKRPLPSNPMARVKILARELAEGAHYEIWEDHIAVSIVRKTKDSRNVSEVAPNHPALIRYMQDRWGNTYPQLRLLKTHNYINEKWLITEKAINLLEEADSSSIFISYKRSESSAFALLMEDRLSQAGLAPFLDKQLQAGDDWQAELEGKIAKSDYFLLILSKETLKSEVTLKEIEWAIAYERAIIPIWHNSFVFDVKDWQDLSPKVAQVLSNIHTIRVIEENPLTYDTALRELLNRFGISG